MWARRKQLESCQLFHGAFLIPAFSVREEEGGSRKEEEERRKVPKKQSMVHRQQAKAKGWIHRKNLKEGSGRCILPNSLGKWLMI